MHIANGLCGFYLGSYDIIETQAHNELTVGTSFVPDDEVITASQAHTEPSPYDTQSTPVSTCVHVSEYLLMADFAIETR